jgi:hypothetical protein
MKKINLLISLIIVIVFTTTSFAQNQKKTTEPKTTDKTVNKPGTTEVKDTIKNNNPKVQDDVPVNTSAVVKLGKPVIEKKDNGAINWTEQFIEAKGHSVMDTKTYTVEGQAQLMAQAGAKADAQRNLLEIIQGVRIVGETTVRNFVTTDDYIYKRLDGFIKGAEIVGDYIVKGNIVEVTMRVPMYGNIANGASNNGLADIVQQKSMSVKVGGTIDPTNPNGTKNPVVNTNNNIQNPSLFPVVTDEDGNIVVDYRQYYDPTKGNIPKYVEMTKEVKDMINLNPKASNIIDGVLDAATGTVKIKTGENSGTPKWLKTVGKVVGAIIKIGGMIIGL